MEGILDLQRFPVDEYVAACALEYLLEERPHLCRMEWRGDQEWYIGWGGRTVVLERGKAPQLKAFRRFEYRLLRTTREEAKGRAINTAAVHASFKKFRETAIANREKGESK